jgi:hypothetical protein
MHLISHDSFHLFFIAKNPPHEIKPLRHELLTHGSALMHLIHLRKLKKGVGKITFF